MTKELSRELADGYAYGGLSTGDAHEQSIPIIYSQTDQRIWWPEHMAPAKCFRSAPEPKFKLGDFVRGLVAVGIVESTCQMEDEVRYEVRCSDGQLSPWWPESELSRANAAIFLSAAMRAGNAELLSIAAEAIRRHFAKENP